MSFTAENTLNIDNKELNIKRLADLSIRELKDFYFDQTPFSKDSLFTPEQCAGSSLKISKCSVDAIHLEHRWKSCTDNKDDGIFKFRIDIFLPNNQKRCFIESRKICPDMQGQGLMLDWQSHFEKILRENNILFLFNTSVKDTHSHGNIVWPLYGFRCREKTKSDKLLNKKLLCDFKMFVNKKTVYGFNNRCLNTSYFSRISDIVQACDGSPYADATDDQKIGKKWLFNQIKSYRSEKYIGLDWNNSRIEDTMVFVLYLKESGRIDLVEKFYPDFADSENIIAKLQASKNPKKNFLIEKYYL